MTEKSHPDHIREMASLGDPNAQARLELEAMLRSLELKGLIVKVGPDKYEATPLGLQIARGQSRTYGRC